MISHAMRRSLPLLPVLVLVLVYFTRDTMTGALIAPLGYLSFLSETEPYLTVVVIPMFAFILPNKFEIELSLTCGMSTEKLFFSKFIALLTCTLVPTYVFAKLFRYVPYEGERPLIFDIYVPENYMVYLIISITVTLLFFISLICFVRVFSRTCYLPVIITFFTHYAFTDFTMDVQCEGELIKYCIFDPFISTYLLGDKVSSSLAEQHPELGLIPNAWTCNRLIFFGISVVLLIATYIMLRRRK